MAKELKELRHATYPGRGKLSKVLRYLAVAAMKDLRWSPDNNRYSLRLPVSTGPMSQTMEWFICPSKGRTNAVNRLIYAHRERIVKQFGEGAYKRLDIYKKRVVWFISTMAEVHNEDE
jgi:hypothetical protein